MAHQVVCFSGPDGALMHEVAHAVAEKLAFAYVDEQIVTRAAEEGGVEPGVVADVERRRSFMERMIDRIAAGPDASSLSLSGGGTVYHSPAAAASDELRGLIRAAIEEMATRGQVVIVAHAASHALARRPDVLRVLVTASPEIRRSRVASARGLGEDEAARLVDASDTARADYLGQFYGARSELPTQYDLVINTDRLGVDAAVALVALAARL